MSSDALTAILVTKEHKETLTVETLEASTVAPTLQDFPCNTPEDEEFLSGVLGQVKEKIKSLDELRRTITDPLNKAKQAVDALFKPPITAYEEAEKAIKAKLAEADRLRREARSLALAQATEAAARGDVKATQAALALAPETGNAAAPSGVTFRYEWEWHLEDIGQVPMEFLALNAATMKLYTSRYKKSETIPPVDGVRFERKAIVVKHG